MNSREKRARASKPQKPTWFSHPENHTDRLLSKAISKFGKFTSKKERNCALVIAHALVDAIILAEQATRIPYTYTMRANILSHRGIPTLDTLVPALILRLRIPSAEGTSEPAVLEKVHEHKVAIGAFASGHFTLSEKQRDALKKKGVDLMRIELTANVFGVTKEAVRKLCDLPVNAPSTPCPAGTRALTPALERP